MKHWRCFAGIIDDVVVYVIVVDDVSDVTTALSLSLDSLLSWIQV